jgi:ribonuclease Z
MIRSLLSSFFLFFVLFSYGQINGNKDSLQFNSPAIKVTLLGTGDPQPIMERFGPSILVQAGVEVLLFDAGRGMIELMRFFLLISTPIIS